MHSHIGVNSSTIIFGGIALLHDSLARIFVPCGIFGLVIFSPNCVAKKPATDYSQNQRIDNADNKMLMIVSFLFLCHDYIFLPMWAVLIIIL